MGQEGLTTENAEIAERETATEKVAGKCGFGPEERQAGWGIFGRGQAVAYAREEDVAFQTIKMNPFTVPRWSRALRQWCRPGNWRGAERSSGKRLTYTASKRKKGIQNGTRRRFPAKARHWE